MSQYYMARRQKNIFDPAGLQPFKLSRTKIDLFWECPRCFYLDRRLGVGRPPGFPFSLNAAVDRLLKKEFDIHRAKQTRHPLMKAYKIKAVPFQHDNMGVWRENFVGVQYLHESTNLLIFGAVDDVWEGEKGELYVVDYKATSKEGEVTLDAEWQGGYKRQIEVYQWLLRHNGFDVSHTGYFVYCNGNTDKEAFDAHLEFDIKLISYVGDDSWIEKTLKELHQCLVSDVLPDPGKECDYCAYRKAAQDVLPKGFT